MITTEETEKILQRQALRLSGLNLLALKGISGVTNESLAESMAISGDEFRKIFRDKYTLVEEICDYYGPGTSGSNLVTHDLMDELVKPYNFMKSFVLRLVKKWNGNGDRLYLKFLLNEQPIMYDDNIISLSYYMNDARSLWWMIFEEMINHDFIKPIDPVILANEFITPLFMCRIENQLPNSSDNFNLVQDTALSHLAFFWENIKQTDYFR